LKNDQYRTDLKNVQAPRRLCSILKSPEETDAGSAGTQPAKGYFGVGGKIRQHRSFRCGVFVSASFCPTHALKILAEGHLGFEISNFKSTLHASSCET
jgi:hypothetical protein